MDQHKQRVEELVRLTLALPASGREAFLQEECAGDARLLSEVHRQLGDGGSRHARHTAGDPPTTLGAQRPSRIGRFQIVQKIGEGGMGAVYQAQQESPRRMVALKVVRPELTSPLGIRRFELEGELLGQLQHPGIAQIFEAGIDRSGGRPRPYFAMELVRGRNLAACALDLTIEERVELLARIADAIQHAHQKGVIHRDLKPGNILVEEGGQPKVLDFGVARTTDGPERSQCETFAGQAIGTLAYMSPEQARGDLSIDTRSDIYALGVLAYELLSGRRPYEVPTGNLLEAVQVICDAQPRALGGIEKALRGDLETIVAKAMRKDRELRYGSAAALADDLRRHLRHEPIEARSISHVYRLQRFVRRNLGLSIGLAATLVALILGLLGTSWQVRQKTRAELLARDERERALAARDEAQVAREEATAQAEIATAINRFLLIDVLEAPDPRRGGREIRVLDVLDRAAERAQAAFAGRPLVEAGVEAALAKTYVALDELDQAARCAERARELYAEHSGPEEPDTLNVLGLLVELYAIRQDFERGIPFGRETLDVQRRGLGETHEETLTTALNLATLLWKQGDAWEEAESLLRHVLRERQRLLGPVHPHTLTAQLNLASFLLAMQRYDESDAIYEEVLALRIEHFGPEHPDTLMARIPVIHRLGRQGRLAEAETRSLDLIDAFRRVFGPRHHQTAHVQFILAQILFQQGKLEEARALHEETLEIRAAALGERHELTQQSRWCLAVTLGQLGQLEEAERLARSAFDVTQEDRPPDHLDRGDARLMLAEILALRGRLEEAESLLVEAVEILAGAPFEHPWRERAAADLDRIRARMQRESDR